MIRELLASLSLANLLALQIWIGLFHSVSQEKVAPFAYLSSVATVCILGMAFWLAGRLCLMSRSRTFRSIRSLFAVCLWGLVVLGVLKPILPDWAIRAILGSGKTSILIATCVSLALLGRLCWQHPERIFRWLQNAALVLSPFIIVTLSQASWQAWVSRDSMAVPGQPPLPLMSADQHRQRTVVILFDEFDYQLAFDPAVRRDSLPVLDGMRRNSFFATHAFPPMHSTITSLPAMLTGRLVRSATYLSRGSGDIGLNFLDGGSGRLSEQKTIFTELRAQGHSSIRMNQAVLPNARLQGDADADVVVPSAPSQLRTLWDYIGSNLVDISTIIPYSQSVGLDLHLLKWLGVPPPSLQVQAVAEKVRELAVNGDADFIFLHILLPHMPVVFNPASGSFELVYSTDYRNNFLGVDRLVGEIQSGLMAAGRWDETNLVIVSDHFFRRKAAYYGVGDHRVPLIVKFAKPDTSSGDFGMPFNTVVLKSMLAGIVRGELKSSAELGAWIATHSKFSESPLLEYRKGW